MDVQISSGVPIGFGVLTTETLAQAEERADPERGDKGYDAAIAAATVAVMGPRRSVRASASAKPGGRVVKRSDLPYTPRTAVASRGRDLSPVPMEGRAHQPASGRSGLYENKR